MITLNEIRIGFFSSSQIYKICAGEKGFILSGLTYIDERRTERRLGRSLDLGGYSRSIAWGNFNEPRVERMLPEYTPVSQQTIKHPTIEGWVGSTDLINETAIGEIKCYEPKNFCKYADALLTEDTEKIKKECPKEYWQLVSNAIINEKEFAEAILYCPYLSEIGAIIDEAASYSEYDAWKYRYIYESEIYDLPYIPDAGYYKNLNRFLFKVPQVDIDLLTDRVNKAIKLL